MGAEVLGGEEGMGSAEVEATAAEAELDVLCPFLDSLQAWMRR